MSESKKLNFDANNVINFSLMNFKIKKHHIHIVDFFIIKINIIINLHHDNRVHDVKRINDLIVSFPKMQNIYNVIN